MALVEYAPLCTSKCNCVPSVPLRTYVVSSLEKLSHNSFGPGTEKIVWKQNLDSLTILGEETSKKFSRESVSIKVDYRSVETS